MAYRVAECEVDAGIESPLEGVCLQEHIHLEEITLPLKYRAKNKKKR